MQLMQTMRISTLFFAGLFVAIATTTAHAQEPANVRVAHLSPDAPAVDVLVDGAVAFPNVMYPSTTAYAELPAGTYNIQVVPAGQTEPVVIDVDLTFAEGTSYTAAAVNTLANIEPLLLVDDNTLSPDRGRLRFVHASPNAPAVDIAIANGGPVLYRNVMFKEARPYRQGPAGTYDLEVRLAGTETVVLDVPGVEIIPNRVLTVFAIGLVEGEPPLSVLASLDAKCFVDLDDNGAIDIADVVRFAELYETRDLSLDFDRNGVVNRTDAFIFLEKWQVSDEVCDC